MTKSGRTQQAHGDQAWSGFKVGLIGSNGVSYLVGIRQKPRGEQKASVGGMDTLVAEQGKESIQP